jgi:DNA-directed RNA polymerase subunit RPC12/RpoP
MSNARKPRTARREDARRTAKDVRDRERLARLEAGGTPDHPVLVETASLVEPVARGLHCPVCGGSLRVDDHTAATIERVPLRLAHVRCPTCGHARVVYFRIVPPLAN